MAYALQPLPPEDRNRPASPSRRLRLRWALLALAIILLSAGGLWALYRVTDRPPVPGAAPLIRADAEPTRKRPTDPGGMQAPGQGTLVLDGKRAEPGVEQLLPPPEAPLPRPAPAEPPAAAPAETALASPAPVTTSSPNVAVKPAPPPSKPAPAATAAVTPRPATAAAKGYRVQLGAVRSSENAKRDWDRLKQQNGDVLGGLDLNIERADLGGRGIYYRIQAGPIADAAAAERSCKELKRRGVDCVLVRP